MKIFYKIVDIVLAVYFFLLANIYFWGYLFGSILSISHLEANKGSIVAGFINMALAPFMVYAAILLVGNEKNKYKFGLKVLAVAWLTTQIYRFFFVTNYRIELTDLSNLTFFGVPFLILWFVSKTQRPLPRHN